MRHPVLIAPSVSVQIEDIRGTLPYKIQGIEHQDYMKCLDEAVKKFKGYKRGSELYIQLRKNNHRVAFEVNTLNNSISVVKDIVYIDIDKDWSVVSYSDKGYRYERHDRITSLCFATYSVNTEYSLCTGSLLKVMKTGVFTVGGTPDKIDMVIAYK